MNYNVLVADEAIEDIFELVRYVHTELCNPGTAQKLYDNLNREVIDLGEFPLKFSDSGIKYRGYIVNKKAKTSRRDNREVFFYHWKLVKENFLI